MQTLPLPPDEQARVAALMDADQQRQADREALGRSLREASERYRTGAMGRAEWIEALKELNLQGARVGIELAYRPWETEREA